jgi:hypothetical protein
MPRLTFFQLFKLLDNNTLELLKQIKIGTVEFDKGSTISRGTLVGGVDFFKYMTLGAELEVEGSKENLELKKIIYTEN